jgi:hypothetical protein
LIDEPGALAEFEDTGYVLAPARQALPPIPRPFTPTNISSLLVRLLLTRSTMDMEEEHDLDWGVDDHEDNNPGSERRIEHDEDVPSDNDDAVSLGAPVDVEGPDDLDASHEEHGHPSLVMSNSIASSRTQSEPHEILDGASRSVKRIDMSRRVDDLDERSSRQQSPIDADHSSAPQPPPGTMMTHALPPKPPPQPYSYDRHTDSGNPASRSAPNNAERQNHYGSSGQRWERPQRANWDENRSKPPGRGRNGQQRGNYTQYPAGGNDSATEYMDSALVHERSPSYASDHSSHTLPSRPQSRPSFVDPVSQEDRHYRPGQGTDHSSMPERSVYHDNVSERGNYRARGEHDRYDGRFDSGPEQAPPEPHVSHYPRQSLGENRQSQRESWQGPARGRPAPVIQPGYEDRSSHAGGMMPTRTLPTSIFLMCPEHLFSPGAAGVLIAAAKGLPMPRESSDTLSSSGSFLAAEIYGLDLMFYRALL